ncbi:RNA methyltransferase [Mycoplasmopsis ciconiae]|uniref:RNA methyltransferase n=1 Tax=Mycoplasmopsis ciconiae TaxID=561067 RepID=A0ABU7MLG0_9BACT|nr:RNA methyltransferase [Mycoplasmopsis ciconiae]
MIITSKDNKIVKNLHKLKSKKYRNLQRCFLVEGEHLVNEAKKVNLLMSTFEFVDNENDRKFENSILISKKILEYLTDTQTPQSVIGLCSYPQNKKKINRVLYLNKLQDPGNIGTLMRLALAFDFDTVVVQNFDVYNPKVIRSSQGAIFSLNVILENDDYKNLIELKNNNFDIYATILDQNAQTLNQISFSDKIVLVLGNEGNGISQFIKDMCDYKIYIPISFESLNVACAGAIIMNKIRNG